ncbi:hypothetical protein ACFVFI_08150 [Streptomyces sp. NPDC057705]|uniref:hypothetical protein n=1 Tax=Streptomyces sp. NPDC057705 TaxID=3346222 RepID=UPI00367667C8
MTGPLRERDQSGAADPRRSRIQRGRLRLPHPPLRPGVRLKKALRVPTPADRGPGQPWRPGTPPPAPIDPDLPSADIPRDKIFSEKISARVRVRPRFEEALRTAREVKAHAPHCRVVFTVVDSGRS